MTILINIRDVYYKVIKREKQRARAFNHYDVKKCMNYY